MRNKISYFLYTTKDKQSYLIKDEHIEMLRQTDFLEKSAYYNGRILSIDTKQSSDVTLDIGCTLQVMALNLEIDMIDHEINEKYMIEPHHVRMINRLHFDNNGSEISTADKRPFGNSDIEGDVYDIIYNHNGYFYQMDFDCQITYDLMRYEYERMICMLPDIIKQFPVKYRKYQYDSETWSWKPDTSEIRKEKLEKILK